ncbi:hypothetical protein [Ahrensia sp. R2A130]|uniref:hypothetical protein n=1 Tax=Ahrensia sp. R2A130 TaxID=744979 RepID=UPI0001E0BC17|nr:hypothetical protein [Ahrensia sp. R2A130]EFL90170.1 conserved hypothetical protein [Ahrensia sp. R2A130]
MEHIEQLKKIRADALNRLRMSEDFRLAGKLGQLLAELGSPVDDNVMAAPAPVASAKPASATMNRSPLNAGKTDDANLEDQLAEELDAALESGAGEKKSPLPFLASSKGDDAKDDKAAKAS